MKKIILFALIALLPVSLFAAEQEKIGVAAAVTGSVKSGDGKKTRTLKSGMPVYLNERIRTDSKGTLQILLLDETVFKLGPDSDMVLDEFVYNPGSSKGKITANITKGVFRFITGKIARKNPKDMNVNLAVGSIGIRGTIVAGTTGADGSTVILAGPGSKNNANEKAGAIFVNSGKKQGLSSGDEIPGNNGQTNGVYIDIPGNGTNIHSDGSMETPHPMGAELAAITGKLNAGTAIESDSVKDKKSVKLQEKKNGGNNSFVAKNSNGRNAEESGSIGEQSGQSGAETSADAAETQNGHNTIGSFAESTVRNSQDDRKRLDTIGPDAPFTPFIPGHLIPGRWYSYSASNIPLLVNGNAATGDFSADFSTAVNFYSRRIDGTQIDVKDSDGTRFSYRQSELRPITMYITPVSQSWVVPFDGSAFLDQDDMPLAENDLGGSLKFTSRPDSGISATLEYLAISDRNGLFYIQGDETDLIRIMSQSEISTWLNSRSGIWNWSSHNVLDITDGWTLNSADLSLNFSSREISGTYVVEHDLHTFTLSITETEVINNNIIVNTEPVNQTEAVISMLLLQQNNETAVKSTIDFPEPETGGMTASVLHTGLSQN